MFEKNLKYYRLMRNMSKKELADACGVTAMAIANYEQGIRKPEMGTINLIAEVLDVHVVDFLASRNSTLNFHHGEFRKSQLLTKSQQEYVKESVEEYFSRFFDAVEYLGGDPLQEIPSLHTIQVTGDYRIDAAKLRDYFKLAETGPVGDLVAMLENNGFLILELDIDNKHFSGMNGTVNEYPYIVIKKNMRAERKRTTIVHELAHLLFMWDDDEEKEKLNEKHATAIAGAFLITDKDLKRELGIRRTRITKDLELICEEYGVSMYLLVTRAGQAGIMSTALVRDFNIRANKANWKELEPNRVKKAEVPILFEQLVYRAINEKEITPQKGAELLKVSVAECKKHMGPLEGISWNL